MQNNNLRHIRNSDPQDKIYSGHHVAFILDHCHRNEVYTSAVPSKNLSQNQLIKMVIQNPLMIMYRLIALHFLEAQSEGNKLVTLIGRVEFEFLAS